MTRTTLLQRGSISVSDFRCSAGPDDTPFAEQFGSHSISYVRKGSFGCHSRGRFFELVAGSILVGHPGDEFMCTHDHFCGAEYLSFFVNPELVEMIGDRTDVWQIGAVPPLPELMVLGELAQAAADGRSDIGLDEVGQLFASRFVEVVSGRSREPAPLKARDRRRAVETALWIDANSHQEIDLEGVAGQAGISPFHFLRLFASVIGQTLPQDFRRRLRCRVRRSLQFCAHIPPRRGHLAAPVPRGLAGKTQDFPRSSRPPLTRVVSTCAVSNRAFNRRPPCTTISD